MIALAAEATRTTLVTFASSSERSRHRRNRLSPSPKGWSIETSLDLVPPLLALPACLSPPSCHLGASTPGHRCKQRWPSGRGFHASTPVPPTWSLTTSTACSNRALRVCCAPLPIMGFAAFRRGWPGTHRPKAPCQRDPALPCAALPPLEGSSPKTAVPLHRSRQAALVTVGRCPPAVPPASASSVSSWCEHLQARSRPVHSRSTSGLCSVLGSVPIRRCFQHPIGLSSHGLLIPSGPQLPRKWENHFPTLAYLVQAPLRRGSRAWCRAVGWVQSVRVGPPPRASPGWVAARRHLPTIEE